MRDLILSHTQAINCIADCVDKIEYYLNEKWAVLLSKMNQLWICDTLWCIEPLDCSVNDIHVHLLSFLLLAGRKKPGADHKRLVFPGKTITVINLCIGDYRKLYKSEIIFGLVRMLTSDHQGYINQWLYYVYNTATFNLSHVLAHKLASVS